jgi:ComF family protein
VQPRCRLCALALPASAEVCGRCLRDPPPWSRAIAACDYGYPWDGLLAALKFHAALDLAPSLAALLTSRLAQEPGSALDALLPVPLSDARLRERGYNQAALLADALAPARGLPVRGRWLLRIMDTPRQTALPRERRLANLRGAFAVEPTALPRLRGLRVALLDDVMTTGATLTAATMALRDAGVAEVQVWVVARTPQ